MDWDKLRIFHAVAEKGSLTHAGEVLHLSQSAVSRQIRALEESLNVTLFHRHARGLILTEQGELLFDATQRWSSGWMPPPRASATARTRSSASCASPPPPASARCGWRRVWRGFTRSTPALKIDLMLEERVLDLPMREADVAIRMKEPSQADLIRKRLMNIRMRLYATPEYLAMNGTPLTMTDMGQHRLICQHPGTAQVAAGANLVQELMTHDVPSTLHVNNYFGVLQAVLNHLGIGVLPDYITEDFPHLVRVLEDVESGEVPVFLAYPEELRHSKRVAAFRDFVTDEIMTYRRRQQP
jgi:DNA-binding transcriptional LysR family regulator